MRVLHLVSETELLNGYTLRTKRLVEAQRRAGVDARIVGPATPADNHLGAAVLGDVLRRLRITTSMIREAPNELATVAEIAYVLTRDGPMPDIIHAHTPWTCAAAAEIVASALEVPWVFEVRGLQEESALADGRSFSPARRAIWKAMGDRARQSAAHVFAISPMLADDALERGARSVSLAPNAVDCEMFRPIGREERARVRARFNLGDAPIIGYFGSIRPLEGIDELIRALPLLRCRAKFLLVGDGDFSPLLGLARDLGVGDLVDFRGQLAPEAVPEVLAAVDCVAITRPDTLVTRMVTPLKPLEALACGVPVVASNLPALRFVGEHGTIFYRPGDLDVLADAIFSAICIEPEIGLQGRAWVERERTWDRVVQDQIKVYEEILR